MENVGPAPAHKVQVMLGGLGQTQFLPQFPPDPEAQVFGVKQDTVGVKDDAIQIQLAHTLPMSVRKCMSCQEMGLQAA